jgi:hypothetical protein
MSGAGDASANHNSSANAPSIVTAIRVDGKNLGAGAYLKDILIADLPEQGSRWLDHLT